MSLLANHNQSTNQTPVYVNFDCFNNIMCRICQILRMVWSLDFAQFVEMLWRQAEDDQERFDRMQKALLMANPESMAFYNAQMRTQRRVCV